MLEKVQKTHGGRARRLMEDGILKDARSTREKISAEGGSKYTKVRNNITNEI